MVNDSYIAGGKTLSLWTLLSSWASDSSGALATISTDNNANSGGGAVGAVAELSTTVILFSMFGSAAAGYYVICKSYWTGQALLLRVWCSAVHPVILNICFVGTCIVTFLQTQAILNAVTLPLRWIDRGMTYMVRASARRQEIENGNVVHVGGNGVMIEEVADEVPPPRLRLQAPPVTCGQPTQRKTPCTHLVPCRYHSVLPLEVKRKKKEKMNIQIPHV